MKVMIPKTKMSIVGPDFIQSPIKLSISLLVSNRIGTIRKCMDSLKIILDAVPSELIAVDTVGEENSDGSLDVVREYTDKIVHFDWTGNFAQARNKGLELAKGEWFLYVDDDEWFDDPTEIIEFFQSGEYLQYGYTQYAIRSYIDEAMTIYSEGWVSRMGRMTKQTKFIHPVHEMLYPMYAPEKKFTKCFAHHVGYIFKSEEEKAKHLQRNLPPILEELEREPENLRLVMQAVQEYLFDKDYKTAEEYCRRGLVSQDRQRDLVWNWIAAMLIRSLLLQNREEDAFQEGDALLENDRLNELARMDIHYTLVSAAQKQNNSDRVLENAFEYGRLARYFDENPEKVFDQVMLSLSDILKEEKRKEINHCFFITSKQLEKYEKLCEYADLIAWNQDYMKQALYFYLVIEASADSGNYDCLTRTTQKICQQGTLPEEWMSEIHKVCNCEDQEKRYSLRKAFANVESEEAYFFVLKAWCAEQDGGDVLAALQKCLDQGLDCAVPHEDLLGICLRTGNDPTPFLKSLYMEDWALSFSQLVNHTFPEDLQNLLDGTNKVLGPINQSQSFALSKMIRQKMLDDPDFPENKLWETTKAYVGDILGYNRGIYQEKLFGEDAKQNLPRETVFALRLQEAVQAKEHGDLDRMSTSLKECIEAYPPRKDLVNRLLEQIKKEMEEQEKQQNEFTALGGMIKEQIARLIEFEKFEEARNVLHQLRTLMPSDPELESLEEKLSASAWKFA